MTIDNWLGVGGLALLLGFGVHVFSALKWYDQLGLGLGILAIVACLVLRNNPTLFKAAPPAPKP
jgi:hypothetical protein